MEYHIRKIDNTGHKNLLDTEFRDKTSFVTLNEVMGDKPQYLPAAKAALLYDDNYLHGMFIVHEKYIIARAVAHMQHVWKDSCVELFFTPGDDISEGYFNLEMNCGGVIYMQHQVERGVGVKAIDKSDFDRIQITTSLNAPIENEITKETEWTLIFSYPYEVMQKYHAGFITPKPGVKWRGNFNKCADESSNPHWITWNRINLPEPQFHRPDYFGELLFV